MKVNKPEFIKAVRIPENIHFNLEDNMCNVELKALATKVSDDINDIIFEEIYKIAKEHGVTDLFLINEQTVTQAFEKQIPRKVRYLNRHGKGRDWRNEDYYNCPACGRRLRNKQHDPYCPKCGQALDWRQEDEK